MTSTSIEEVISIEALRECYPVMDQLRPVGEERFLETVNRMREERDYQLFAMRDEERTLLGLAGITVETNLYHGRHTWVHDLVIDEKHRGNGYGGQFLSWIEGWAEKRDCSCVELASGLWRDEAHGFYGDKGMKKYCFTFKTDLSTKSLY